jgi:hypothetical protein
MSSCLSGVLSGPTARGKTGAQKAKPNPVGVLFAYDDAMTDPSDPAATAFAAANEALAEAARILADDGELEEAERYVRLAERIAVAGAKIAELQTPSEAEDEEESDEAILIRFHDRMRALMESAHSDDIAELCSAGWENPS